MSLNAFTHQYKSEQNGEILGNPHCFTVRSMLDSESLLKSLYILHISSYKKSNVKSVSLS